MGRYNSKYIKADKDFFWVEDKAKLKKIDQLDENAVQCKTKMRYPLIRNKEKLYT
jgi:hypothetical protein